MYIHLTNHVSVYTCITHMGVSLNGGTPSSHPLIAGIFHEINYPAMGNPSFMETRHYEFPTWISHIAGINPHSWNKPSIYSCWKSIYSCWKSINLIVRFTPQTLVSPGGPHTAAQVGGWRRARDGPELGPSHVGSKKTRNK